MIHILVESSESSICQIAVMFHLHREKYRRFYNCAENLRENFLDFVFGIPRNFISHKRPRIWSTRAAPESTRNVKVREAANCKRPMSDRHGCVKAVSHYIERQRAFAGESGLLNSLNNKLSSLPKYNNNTQLRRLPALNAPRQTQVS